MAFSASSEVASSSETRRIGARGCPSCGGHNTEGLRGARVIYWCRTCRHRWYPCEAHCRGYRVVMDGPGGPCVGGCPDCGVPDRVARYWPEAFRAVAKALDKLKKHQLAENTELVP